MRRGLLRSLLLVGPALPVGGSCDDCCGGKSRERMERAYAQEQDVQAYIDAHDGGALDVTDPLDGKRYALRFPRSPDFHWTDGDHATTQCTAAEATELGADGGTVEAWVCFTIAPAGGEPHWRVADVALANVDKHDRMRWSCPKDYFRAGTQRPCAICGGPLEPMKECPDGAWTFKDGYCLGARDASADRP